MRGRRPRRGKPFRVLVLGGARSGKSVTAERMLAARDRVDYVATGAVPDDADPEVAIALRSIPSAEVRWYAGADHDLHAQQPSRVAGDLLEFASTAGLS